MKHLLVHTENALRIWAAGMALEESLMQDDVRGLGLVYGAPGLGKTMAVEEYNVRTNKEGRHTAILVRALAIWTETSMLKDLLAACGKSAGVYRKDVFYDELKKHLQDPVIFIIDQIDAIAEKRAMVTILQDIHDQTRSPILMVGEDRVDGILRRHTAFHSRINTSAIVRVSYPNEGDVKAMVDQRCDFPVAPEVSHEIFRMVGRSMRHVVDMIRALEMVARANDLTKIGISELRMAMDIRPALATQPDVVKRPVKMAAVAGGANG